MKKTDDGYLITNEDVKKASRVLGYVGISVLATRLLRLLFWPPVREK